MEYNTLIGRNAGSELPEDSKGIVIIGHDVKSLDRHQEGVVFIGERVALSRKVWDAISEALKEEDFDLVDLVTPYVTHGIF